MAIDRVHTEAMIRKLLEQVETLRKQLKQDDWEKGTLKPLLEKGHVVTIVEDYLGEGGGIDIRYLIDGKQVMGEYYDQMLEDIEDYGDYLTATVVVKKSDGNWYGAGGLTHTEYKLKEDKCSTS